MNHSFQLAIDLPFRRVLFFCIISGTAGSTDLLLFRGTMFPYELKLYVLEYTFK